MSWTAYEVVFKMLSPLHSGYAKVGNIQRTRTYATARMLWGALTSRLTRMLNSRDYAGVGESICESLRSSYFFPALGGGEIVILPDAGSDSQYLFRRRGSHCNMGDVSVSAEEVEMLLLTSYVSTAIDHGRRVAEEGSLHEVEVLSHRVKTSYEMIDLPLKIVAGGQVYLSGYFFLSDAAERKIRDNWQEALKQLQTGGERTYGYGSIYPYHGPVETDNMFGYPLNLDGASPAVEIPQSSPIPAHIRYHEEAPLIGSIEPYLGRETSPQGNAGVRLTSATICWIPGSYAKSENTQRFCVTGGWGIWEWAR